MNFEDLERNKKIVQRVYMHATVYCRMHVHRDVARTLWLGGV